MMKTIKSWVLSLFVSLAVIPAVSSARSVTADFYGFISTQFYYQNRESYEGSEGLFYLFPKDRLLDVNGNDLNECSRAGYFAIASRLGAQFYGPEIFGAQTNGVLEADFSGGSGTSFLFTIRQAYLRFDWEKSNLTLGQAWHPMTEVYPETNNINLGTPYALNNRSPMIKYAYSFGDKNSYVLTGALMYQLTHASMGPNGRSPLYQRYSGIPEFMLLAEGNWNNFHVGIGGDYVKISPRTPNATGVKLSKEYSESLVGMLRIWYKSDKFTAKAAASYGADMSRFGSMSGYAATGTRSDGSYTYTPVRSLDSWVYFKYGTKWKVGVMAGMHKNLGLKDGKSILDTERVYMTGGAIDKSFRVAPHVAYTVKNLTFALEYECTMVDYGSFNPDATVSDTHTVTNHRPIFSLLYTFF